MIDHPEDYAGPTEPCGDLSAAPLGGGEPDRSARRYDLKTLADAFADAPDDAEACGWTGNPPGMLQDDSRGLSQWLASKPDAMRHAREAAAAIKKPLPNCAVECEALCQMSTRGYCERPRSPQGWSDSGPVEGA